MTNPTNPFNWQMPTASDLVTDLPADFETFGQAVATSMADLLGGTTGQVLSKASNTDMDFTWVAQDDSNAIQNAIVDAKGDLISASAADTPARLAVGNNGESLVADSSTATGLRYQGNFAAGKNAVINGAFNIWQRGTSFSLTSAAVNVFSADRFTCYVTGATATLSQQAFTAGTAPVSGYESQYFHRIANGSGGTYYEMQQRIEDVRTFAGQTVTFSFWGKASTATTAAMFLLQNFGSGGSSNVSSSAASVAFTTSWQRFTLTTTLGSMSGKTIGTGSYLSPYIYYVSGTVSSVSIDTWGWQVEASNTATAFQTATGTLQGELAACQRYYYRQTGVGAGSVFAVGGIADTTTTVFVPIFAPVIMRAQPSSLDFSALRLSDVYTGVTNVTNVTGVNYTTNSFAVTATVASGLTTGRGYQLQSQSASGFIGFSAEL